MCGCDIRYRFIRRLDAPRIKGVRWIFEARHRGLFVEMRRIQRRGYLVTMDQFDGMLWCVPDKTTMGSAP